MTISTPVSYTGYFLGPFMRPLTDLLLQLSGEIGEGDAPSPTSLLGRYQAANTMSWQKATDLVRPGSFPAQGANFAGRGAQAFLQVAQRLLFATDHTLGLLNQVETSISVYTTSVISQCNREDGNLSVQESHLWQYCNQRPDVKATVLFFLPQNGVSGIIREIIGRATLVSVTQDGPASDLLSALDTVSYRILDTIPHNFQNVEKIIPALDTFPLSNLADLENDVIAALQILFQEMQMILKRWASHIQQETATLLQELTHLGEPGRLSLNASPLVVGRAPLNLFLVEPHHQSQPLMPNSTYNLIENVVSGLPSEDPRAIVFSPPDEPTNDPLTPGGPTNPPQNGHISWKTITVRVDDPITSVNVVGAVGGGPSSRPGERGADDEENDPGIPLGLPFIVKGAIKYTLDVPLAWRPYMVPHTGPYPPPVIRNIWHNVVVVGGRNPTLDFSFSVSSSVQVYSGNGTLLQTVTGVPAGTMYTENDIDLDEAWQDVSRIATTVPYQPPPWDFVGPPDPLILFRLKHILWVVADPAYNLNSNPLPTPFHDVDSGP